MKGGSEVPYQVDGSKTLVRAEGGIAANSTHVWMTVSGARAAAAQVSVIDGGTYWQIDNTLTAVRVPKTIPVTTPAVIVPDAGVPEEGWIGSMPQIQFLPRSKVSAIVTELGPDLAPTICGAVMT